MTSKLLFPSLRTSKAPDQCPVKVHQLMPFVYSRPLAHHYNHNPSLVSYEVFASRSFKYASRSNRESLGSLITVPTVSTYSSKTIYKLFIQTVQQSLSLSCSGMRKGRGGLWSRTYCLHLLSSPTQVRSSSRTLPLPG